MAILSVDELVIMRNRMESLVGSPNYRKSHINGALQQIENFIESQRFKNDLSDRIDTGSSPHVFTLAEKDLLFKVYMENKARGLGS